MPDSRSTSDAAMKPFASAWIFPRTSTSCCSLAMDAPFVGGRRSDHEVLLDRGELVARHRQVPAALVEHEVDEERVVPAERADDVVLLAERDEDVFDAVLEL